MDDKPGRISIVTRRVDNQVSISLKDTIACIFCAHAGGEITKLNRIRISLPRKSLWH